jgi:hypothetical protein
LHSQTALRKEFQLRGIIHIRSIVIVASQIRRRESGIEGKRRGHDIHNLGVAEFHLAVAVQNGGRDGEGQFLIGSDVAPEFGQEHEV